MKTTYKIIGLLLLVGVIGGLIYYWTTIQTKNQYLIDIKYTSGGEVTPSKNVLLDENSNLEIKITPSTDYYIKDVLIDNVSKGEISNYQLLDVTKNHTINVIFEKITTSLEMSKLWDSHLPYYDVKTSNDGEFIAAVTKHTLLYYSKDDDAPLWSATNIQEASFIAVLISSDGNSVAALDDAGKLYFYSNAKNLQDNPAFSWTSGKIKGIVYEGLIKMSNDGESIIVIDSGKNILQYKNCLSKKGLNLSPDKTITLNDLNIRSISASSDARYLVVGGNMQSNGNIYPYISYFDLVNGRELWHWQSTFKGNLYNVVLSSNGQNIVSAIIDNDSSFSGLYYWKNVSQISSNNPKYSWYGGVTGLDSIYATSSDGSETVSLCDFTKGIQLIWENAGAISDGPSPYSSLGPNVTTFSKTINTRYVISAINGDCVLSDLKGNQITSQSISEKYYWIINNNNLGILFGENGMYVFNIS